ncbi:MAG: T9SS type A sorting domain-containing protein [Bacteroidota bacterium]
MKQKAILLALVCLSICIGLHPSIANGQSLSGFQHLNSPVGRVDFSISNPNAKFLAFYDFKDGNFAHTPNNLKSHSYPAGTFQPTVFLADRYDINSPKFLTSTPSSFTITQSNPTSPNPVNMTAEVKIGRAFQNTASSPNVYILTITNKSVPFFQAPQGVSGTVTIDMASNFNIVNAYSYGNGVPVLNANFPPSRRRWTFSGLKLGEQRHFFIYVAPPSNFSPSLLSPIITQAKLRFSHSPDNPINVSETSYYTVYPYDPNKIYVSHPCVVPNTIEGQKLDYIVHFQNEGQGAAKDVFIQLFLPDLINTNSIVKIDASHDCVWQNHGTHLDITYRNIQLPGLKQIGKGAVHPSETCGYFRFSLCTEPNLPAGHHLNSVAEIYFDNEAPIATNVAQTYSTQECVIDQTFCGLGGTTQDVTYSDRSTFNPTNASDKLWKVFPNPVRSRLYVKASDPIVSEVPLEIAVFDLAGKLQFQQTWDRADASLEIIVENLAAGTYIYQVVQGSAQQHGRFVKL